MHLHLALPLLFTTSIALTRAQVIFNTSTYTFTCPATPPNGTYCTGPSLTSSIIIRCTGTTGIAGNCNDNLAGVPPIGVKGFAACYQTTPKAGDAACSYNGTVYPNDGASFPISSSSNNNNNSSSSGPASNLNTTSTPTSSPPGSGYTPLADLASAPYPIANSTAAATANASGTGTANAPDKTTTTTMTGGSGSAFTSGTTAHNMGAGYAELAAGVAALGLMLLLL